MSNTALGRVEIDNHWRDTSWSSVGLGASEALAAWARNVSGEIAEMAVEGFASDPFAAFMRRFALGPIDLNHLSTRAQRVIRSPAMVARTRVPFYALIYTRHLPVFVTHAQRSFEVPTEGYVLLHHDEAYDLSFPHGSDCLTVHIPEDWLSAWVANPQTYVARPIAPNPWSRPLGSTLEAIVHTGLDESPLSRIALSDQMGSMLSMLLSTSPPIGRSQKLHQAILKIVNRRFAEGDLSPEAVAMEQGISVRHLHRSFATQGVTFGRTLSDIRIRHSKALLSQSLNAGTSVGEIAWHVGFADQSHFARLFRASTGVSPSRYRKSIG